MANPSTVETLLAEAGGLEDGDDAAKAQLCYEQALELDSSNSEAHLRLGHLLHERGQAEAAAEHYRAILAADPAHGNAFRSLVLTVPVSPSDPLVSQIESRRSDTTIATDSRAQLLYGLGHLYDQHNRCDEAFACWSAAGQILRKTHPPKHAFDELYFRRIRESFESQLASVPTANSTSATMCEPIFVVGLPRSGTSLVEQILASHPQVFGAGEITTLAEVLHAEVTGRGALPYPECRAALGPATLEKIAERYVQAVRSRAPSDRPRLCDKLGANFEYLAVICAALPRARIIHCTRHPLDISLSCFSRYFGHRQLYTNDLSDLGAHYQRYSQLMQHWDRVLPGRIAEVRYEELVADFEVQVRRLLEAAGLSWDPRCLQFHTTQRRVRTASSLQVRTPLFQDSVGRWRRYEQQLAPLGQMLGV